tara:strand:- start:638 stop:1294 length:657 start_codon:yes stop_codon:yes gene_type:complete
MKDYRVKITIRNERILSVMESMGFPSVRNLCEVNKLDYNRIVNIISGKIKPLNEKGELIPVVIKLLDVLNMTPEEAFTDRQLQGFRKTSVIIKLEEKEMIKLVNPIKNQEQKLIETEVKHKLEKAINSLRPMEKTIIKLRYGINDSEHTLEEIGLIFNLSRERVRQIEKKAINRLKHPRKSTEILLAGADEIYPEVNITKKNINDAIIYEKIEEKKCR